MRIWAILGFGAVWILFLIFSGFLNESENEWAMFIIGVVPVTVFGLYADEKWPRKRPSDSASNPSLDK